MILSFFFFSGSLVPSTLFHYNDKVQVGRELGESNYFANGGVSLIPRLVFNLTSEA